MSEARLADLCERIVDCPHSTPAWTDHGAIVLRNQNIRGGRLDLSAPSYTDEEHFIERTRRATPMAGDLVITREAPMGEVCMVPAGLRCCLGQRMVLLRPDRRSVEPRYLLYALQSKTVQDEIGVSEGTGSTVSNLRIPLLEGLPIPMRSLPEQREIAHILGTLDDKIELNRRLNETLEGTARTLFEASLVNRTSVCPLITTPRSEDRARTGIVNAADAEHWTDCAVGEICDSIFSGGTPDTRNPEYWGGSIPWLSSGETRAAFVVSTEKTITLSGVEGSSTRLARAGDTVVASAGQGHTRGQCSLLMADTYVNQSIVALRPNNRATSLYLFFELSRRYDELRGLSDSHSSRGSLTTKLLAGLRVCVPPRKLLAAFDEVVEPMVQRAANALRESIALAELRDTLLPKLLSGALRVKDAERLAVEAGA